MNDPLFSRSLPHSVSSLTQLTPAAEETAALSHETLTSASNLDPHILGYQVQEILEHAESGTLYRAFDEKLKRVIAIKVLDRTLATSVVSRNQFVREAQAAAAVRSDYVVVIYDVAADRLPPYVVMEHVDGPTLQTLLNAQAPLPLKEILRIGLQLAEGLAAVHKQGLVQCDLKPANVTLESSERRVKIMPFGLLIAVDELLATQSDRSAGASPYMSPEQAQGLPLDHRSDLFSLGTVLYLMCTGQPAFAAAGTQDVLKRVSEETPQPIRELNNEIPPWLADMVSKLHAKQPEDRFQSAREVADLLGASLAEVQLHGTLTPFGLIDIAPIAESKQETAVSVGGERAPKRKRVAAAGIVLLGAIGVAFGIWWLARSPEEPNNGGSPPLPPLAVEPVDSIELAKTYMNLGKRLYQKQNLPEAIAAYHKAIELNPKDGGAFYNLGLALGKQGKLNEAITAYRKAIELDFRGHLAHWALAAALKEQRNWTEAIATLEAHVRREPDFAHTYNNLAWDMATCPDAGLRDPPRALKFAQKRHQLAAPDGISWSTLGVAYYRAGDYVGAVAALEESMKMRKGGDSFNWFFLAMAHWQLRDKDEAHKWYEKAVAWMDKNQPKNGELIRFRAEASELLTGVTAIPQVLKR